MRPAGMSSDEDEDDYFSTLVLNKRNVEKDDEPLNIIDHLPENHSSELRTILTSASKCTLFHKATKEGDIAKMKELIDDGVSVDDSRIDEWTPLMKACADAKHEIVNFLLENGADPNVNKEMLTPLMACCLSNYSLASDMVECVRLLILYDANINASDAYNMTALMKAAANGCNHVLDELLRVPNIDINKTDTNGWNALFHAINRNNRTGVKKLLDAGIDTNIMDYNEEYGAIELAEMNNCREILKILKKFKGEEDAENKSVTANNTGNSPFVVRKSLDDFVNQFPDENGLGGFSNDVRDIFLGVGFEKMYDKIEINVSFPYFLTMKDFREIGIKYGSARRKLHKGVHRYHLGEWTKDSFYSLADLQHLRMDDCIKAVSNITKHLAIMYATLEYVEARIEGFKRKCFNDSEEQVIHYLINSYSEIESTRMLVYKLSQLTDKIKPSDEVEADFIGEKTNAGHPWKRFLFKAAIAVSCLYICDKFKYLVLKPFLTQIKL